MSDHRHIDERSLAFGRAIAARLRARPELLARARATVARWKVTASPRSNADLQAWLEALEDGSPEGVIALLTGSDERAIRMRQSNPFAGVLSPRERTEILKRYQAHDAAAT